jgi:aldose 1-epimerase
VFKHLMLYADPAYDFFCVEPQTNAACAFNNMTTAADQDLNVLVLEPGETSTGSILLRVAALR